MIKKYKVFDVTYDGGGALFPNDLREDDRGFYERARMSLPRELHDKVMKRRGFSFIFHFALSG
jgi:hypothetical protein